MWSGRGWVLCTKNIILNSSQTFTPIFRQMTIQFDSCLTTISRGRGSLEILSRPIIGGVGGEWGLFTYSVERGCYQKSFSERSMVKGI